MKIFIIPVSGGGFAAQLGVMHHLMEAKRIIPDLILGSSGGNVTAYISMLSNWYSKAILKNCHLLDSTLFVEPWTPSFLPTWLLFPLTKSIFRRGDGVTNLFKQVFTKRSVQQVEIWTGTYNETKQKAKIWCNLSEEEAKLKPCKSTENIYDMEPLYYSDGDVDLISQYTYGSAAIPFLTPGIEIENERYVDGGAAYSSPLVPMADKIRKVVDITKKKLQIHYFCSYDMDQIFSDSVYASSVGLLIHSNLLSDRAFALTFLQNFGKCDPKPKIYREVDSLTIKKILDEVENRNYLMVFSPIGSPSVSITSFTGTELQKVIKSVKFSIYLWVLNN